MQIRNLLIAAALTLPLVFAADLPKAPSGKGWVKIFDGKSLNGWKAVENEGSWSVKDGNLVGDGERSHLFYTVKQCKNCEFYAEVKLNHEGNSGMYFRAKMEKGFPPGYESQVENTSRDPRKTGSLLQVLRTSRNSSCRTTPGGRSTSSPTARISSPRSTARPSWTLSTRRTLTRKATWALQQHNKGSIVTYRNLMMREIPAKK